MAPQPSDDQAVAAELDFQLRAPSPASRPVLDQLGQPVLDAVGQPIPAVAAPAMLPPLMLVPPTPRSASSVPGTPRGRARSCSETPARRSSQPVPEQQSLPPEQQALPPEQQALPPEQQALPPEQQALPPEQQALPGSTRQSVSQASGGHDRLGSQLASRQVSTDSAGMRRSSLGTSEMQCDLEQQLIGEIPSESMSRGTKRPADALPEPQSTSQSRPRPEDVPPAVESLLLFCQACGEQHRIQVNGVDSCSRCLSTRTVSSPMHVESWFGEVMEREALEQRFENRMSGSTSPLRDPMTTPLGMNSIVMALHHKPFLELSTDLTCYDGMGEMILFRSAGMDLLQSSSRCSKPTPT